MARRRGLPEPDMAKQLDSIRAAREAKEAKDLEAAGLGREAERAQLEGFLNDLGDRVSSHMRRVAWECFRAGDALTVIKNRVISSSPVRPGPLTPTSRRPDPPLRPETRKTPPIGLGHTEASDPAPPGTRVVDGQIYRTFTARPRVVEPAGIKVLGSPRIAPAAIEPPGSVPADEPETDDGPGPVMPPGQDWRAIIADRIQSEDYSFNELGNETGVSPSVIARFVKGERDIQVATAEKLCAALDLVLVPREMLVASD